MTDWMADAACHDSSPELFFTEVGADTAAPKLICAGCPVRRACLQYALYNYENWGVWGGMSARERKAERRRRVRRRTNDLPPVRIYEQASVRPVVVPFVRRSA